MEENYLSHHGIKGQKWGVEHGPPYPVRRGTGGKPKTTSVVKSRLKAALNDRAESRKKKKDEKEKRIAEIKEKKAQKEAEKHVEDYEKLKKQVVKHPKDLYKNKDSFSKEEIKKLIEEIEFDRKIQDVRDTEIQRGLDRYKRLGTGVQTTATLMKNLKEIYNVASDVHNAFVETGRAKGTKWPTLGGNSDDKKSDNKDSSPSILSPKVSSPAPKAAKAAAEAVKKHGSTPMSQIDKSLADEYRYAAEDLFRFYS